LITSTGISQNNYGFTGEQQFAEADALVFLRARYYAPVIGRFISRDPIGYDIGGLNLYVYVGNNPVRYKDPEGLMKCSECWDRYTKARSKVLKEAVECHNDCGPSDIGPGVALCIISCAKTGYYFPVCLAGCVGGTQLPWAMCYYACAKMEHENIDAINLRRDMCLRDCCP
jgi:RHS repeat-associated protein